MTEKTSKLLFMLGPTAVGKSAVALNLAKRLDGEIVSADSMQTYRGMDIGTAKPSPEEQKQARHHLIDILDIHEMCAVGDFKPLAVSAIADIQARGRLPIITGGSGMYVRALTQGLLEGPGRDESLRESLEGLKSGELREKLLVTDPQAAAKIDPNDRRRMIRALEFHAATGTTISSHQSQWKTGEGDGDGHQTIFCLSRPREELYRRSDQRVLEMFEAGWEEEVRRLMEKGLERAPTAAKAIGYREMMTLLHGEMGRKETIALIQQKTRHFIKRQLTWFRKEPNLHWIEIQSGESVSEIAERVRGVFDAQ